MCGRYTLKTSPQQLMSLFQVPVLPETAPRYNIAPTQQVLVFRAADEADAGNAGQFRGGNTVATPAAEAAGAARQATLMRWGLVPSWAKDLSIGSQMINARSETAAEKPSFRSAFVRRRCLIPADGFYEWQKLADGRKQPWWIHPADGGVLAFA
ncbi:MAG: SOS response-associated peptidase, partial [Planctomyces sp.]